MSDDGRIGGAGTRMSGGGRLFAMAIRAFSAGTPLGPKRSSSSSPGSSPLLLLTTSSSSDWVISCCSGAPCAGSTGGSSGSGSGNRFTKRGKAEGTGRTSARHLATSALGSGGSYGCGGSRHAAGG